MDEENSPFDDIDSSFFEQELPLNLDSDALLALAASAAANAQAYNAAGRPDLCVQTQNTIAILMAGACILRHFEENTPDE